MTFEKYNYAEIMIEKQKIAKDKSSIEWFK